MGKRSDSRRIQIFDYQLIFSCPSVSILYSHCQVGTHFLASSSYGATIVDVGQTSMHSACATMIAGLSISSSMSVMICNKNPEP